MARSGHYYRFKLKDEEPEIIDRMKELIGEQNTMGCEIMHGALRREGLVKNHKRVENAHIESFNGKLRHECLNQHYFKSLDEARILIENWRDWYNSFRPHQSLAGLTPAEFNGQWSSRNSNPMPDKFNLQTV